MGRKGEKSPEHERGGSWRRREVAEVPVSAPTSRLCSGHQFIQKTSQADLFPSLLFLSPTARRRGWRREPSGALGRGRRGCLPGRGRRGAWKGWGWGQKWGSGWGGRAGDGEARGVGVGRQGAVRGREKLKRRREQGSPVTTIWADLRKEAEQEPRRFETENNLERRPGPGVWRLRGARPGGAGHGQERRQGLCARRGCPGGAAPPGNAEQSAAEPGAKVRGPEAGRRPPASAPALRT